MKLVNVVRRELNDLLIADRCHDCCMCCKHYKLVKDKNKMCDIRKARGRMVQREVKKFNKDKAKPPVSL